MADDGYPWLRKERETQPAYDAFRAYLMTQGKRSTYRTAEEVGKSATLLQDWCVKWDWVERSRAYDNYLVEAQTDGAVEWITAARTETQKLADKWRGLINDLVDDCIRKRSTPPVALSTAVGVLLKMQDASVPPVDDTKMAAELDRVAKLLEKVTGDREKV